MGICLIKLDEVFLGLLLIVLATGAGCFGPLLLMWQDARKNRNISEEEFNRQWMARDARAREMLAMAWQIYAKAPLGIWRWVNAIDGQYSLSVISRRWIAFKVDGTGRYGVETLGDYPESAETLFQWKPESPGHITVKLTSPPTEKWLPVEYGFEISRASDGSPDLVIWLDGENPLRPDLSQFWPFHDDFKRSAE